MKLINLLDVIDCEHNMKVLIENNVEIEAEISGDQASIMKMLSSKMLESDVSCIAARDGNTLYVWLEDLHEDNT